MAILLKEGIQLTASKTVNEILRLAEPIFTTFGVPLVVTAGTDGHHGEHSKHYTAEALDLRVRDIKPELHNSLIQLLKKRFGQDYDIVLEVDHVHIERDLHGRVDTWLL